MLIDLRNSFDVNHLAISFACLMFIILISNFCKIALLRKILLLSISANLFFFNFLAINSNFYSFKSHLPLHLCYLTEIGILLSLFIKNHKFTTWMLLNAMFGAVTALLNSNLDSSSSQIERLHFFISHSNLALFTIILYKSQFKIKYSNLIFSINANLILVSAIHLFNYYFSTNYLFTLAKPKGINISFLLPEWPFYYFFLIFFGLASYYITFILFNTKSKIFQ